jgi:hypothetical protein
MLLGQLSARLVVQVAAPACRPSWLLTRPGTTYGTCRFVPHTCVCVCVWGGGGQGGVKGCVAFWGSRGKGGQQRHLIAAEPEAHVGALLWAAFAGDRVRGCVWFVVGVCSSHIAYQCSARQRSHMQSESYLPTQCLQCCFCCCRCLVYPLKHTDWCCCWPSPHLCQDTPPAAPRRQPLSHHHHHQQQQQQQ